MKARPLVLVLFLSIWLGNASPLSAEPLVDHERRFTIDIPPTLAKQPAGSALHRYGTASGVRISVSHIDYPNLPAWWKHDQALFFVQLQSGIAKAARNYRLKRQRSHRIDRVPVYDVHFERIGPEYRELVWMRFVLHRGFAISATVTTPLKATRAQRKTASAIVDSLLPYATLPGSMGSGAVGSGSASHSGGALRRVEH